MKQIFPALLSALALVACGPSGTEKSPGGVSIRNCTALASDAIGGPISLIDHTGKRVTEADFKGKDTLVYFGFTYCAAACPVTLTMAGAVIEMLPEDVEPPQTLLISFDPERDTPEQLALYVESNGFPEDLIGLTGTEEEIDKTMKAFATYKQRVEMPDSAAGYTYGHPDYLYLMDPDWKLKAIFPIGNNGFDAEQIASCVSALS